MKISNIEAESLDNDVYRVYITGYMKTGELKEFIDLYKSGHDIEVIANRKA